MRALHFKIFENTNMILILIELYVKSNRQNRFATFVFIGHLNLGVRWQLLIQYKNSWNLPIASSFTFRRSVTNFLANPFQTFFWSLGDEFYILFLLFYGYKRTLCKCVQSVTFELSYDKAVFLSGKNTWEHITI